MPACATHHIHLISDSTGETVQTMARAALAVFEAEQVAIHVSVFVRSRGDLDAAIDSLRADPGLVCFTMVNTEHRQRLEAECNRLGQPAIAVLDPLVAQLSRFLGQSPAARVGMQYQLDRSYFERITALDFAIAHDDGALGTRLRQAEVILTGVSRTSKTPTCIYLAYRGIKAANMPLVPGHAPDPAFFEALDTGTPVIALTASPTRLAQIRQQRLDAIGDRNHDYADLDRIREEVAEARLFFERHHLPVIDVTRRSIEETAAEVLAMLRERQEGAS